jgi:hypothetical protein
VDTDSHLSLLSEPFFQKLARSSKIIFAKRKAESWHGMGGQKITSPHPPLLLTVQIGNTVFENIVFHMTKSLTTSDALLGTDFLLLQVVAAVPLEVEGSKIAWFITVGPADNPTEKVPALISNKIVVKTTNFTHFAPMETKKIKVLVTQKLLSKSVLNEKISWPIFEGHSKDKFSPYEIVDTHEEDSSVSVFNSALCPSWLGPNKTVLKSQNFVQSVSNEPYIDPLLKTHGVDDEIFGIDSLEPGIQPLLHIDKKAELDFIKCHTKIPEEFKDELIAFLEEIPDLYSGPEFSKKVFPPEVFTHDVEFLSDLPGLHSKPFPVSGIRLTQLKENIAEMVANGVLVPGDSNFTSPVSLFLKSLGREKPQPLDVCVLIIAILMLISRCGISP